TNWSSNHLNTFILESSLFCIPFNATHHTERSDSWLDVILLDDQSKLGNYFKSDALFIAGHDYLYCEYQIDLPKPVEKFIVYRNFKNCDHTALSMSLVNALCLGFDVLNNIDPNELLEFFLKGVLDALDDYAPVVKCKINGNSNCWITRDLKNKCRECDKLYKLAKRTGDQIMLKHFRIRRKELKIELNHARETYLKNALVNLPTGRTVWSGLKHLGLIKGKQSSPLNYFDPNVLNDYYAIIVRQHEPCNVEFLDSLFTLYSSKVHCSFDWSMVDIVDVTKALNWTAERGLKLNLNETVAMIIGSNGRLRKLDVNSIPPIVVDGIALPYVNSTKCLGLHISNNLSWKLHVSYTIKKINSAIHSLKVRKNIFTQEIRKLLISATVLPLIDYCSAVLIDYTAENDLILQRAINILNVMTIRTYFIATYFFKLLQIDKPTYLSEQFIDIDSRRSQGLALKSNNVNFEIPHFTSNYYENSFVITVIRLWQTLPPDIIGAYSIEVFKTKLLNYLMEQET
ncbi:Protein of unknown function, partial [Cotesia congregata]